MSVSQDSSHDIKARPAIGKKRAIKHAGRYKLMLSSV